MTVVQKLQETISQSPSVAKFLADLKGERSVSVKGAVGALKSFLLAALLQEFQTQVLYLGSDLEEVEAMNEEAEQLIGEEKASFFTGEIQHRYGLYFSNKHSKTSQLSTLEALSVRNPHVVVAHSSALKFRLPASHAFLSQRISVGVGDSFEFDTLIRKLVGLGFVRESRVESQGQMSVRGGLIDVFPFSAEYPYRIEFWGDEVESLRQFDPVTQRSLKQGRKILLYPQEFDSETAANSDILDFLREDAILVLDEPQLIKKDLVTAPDNTDKMAADETEEPDRQQNQLWQRVEAKFAGFKQVNFHSFSQGAKSRIDFKCQGQDSLKGNLKLLRQSFERLATDRFSNQETAPAIFFLAENDTQRERLEEIFEEEDMLKPNVHLATLGLHRGFVFPEANLAVFTDHEFYGRQMRLKLPRKSFKGLTLKQFRSLNVGDYIVHTDHGIGIFRGLKKIDVRGRERECLHIEYQGGDNLYVRFERMDRVHKYASKDGMKPALSKLGSGDWQKLKKRTKQQIKDIANELIEIYSRRKASRGYSFSEDVLWERELEASFQYEDTPDQVKATIEVKRDMHSDKPMDRLVCGDVGFGKTEIAIRAAFKSVLNGKQVAMLVPTTILAYQHLQTFRQRLQDFPVKVEMLSRFRTKAEQRVIVDGVKDGQVDIVIGTHRMLSKDVSFKDLGLMIIDEEQRFGVRQKERLKSLKASIDILTLTATPIPRTLHLSLMGARDITNINTAPKNRLPIFTEILPFNKSHIREVILNELERDGQVFFVHNRVQTIERIATMLSGLVPEANVIVAHGQMPEKELEKVMVDFMERKYEILVSTMIIESGLDMPNVNTIIVNRADKLGLAQLYQLRGRVGRSHHRAYAYLVIPPIETLTEDAIKRLRAIEEFSEIGSGSQLAMRDLEIRGAGNLLGAQQSGFIDALGFDLYNKILDEAVVELKKERNHGEPPAPEVETQIEIEVDAFLPDSYIQDGSDRVDIYRRLTEASHLRQIEELTSELQDRFGRLPGPVCNLLNYLAVRIVGKELGLERVKILDTEMVAEFSPICLPGKGEPFQRWLGKMVENANSRFEFVQDGGLALRLPFSKENEDNLLETKDFLRSLSPNTKPEVES